MPYTQFLLSMTFLMIQEYQYSSMTLWVEISVGRPTTLFHTEVSQHLLDESPQMFLPTILGPQQIDSNDSDDLLAFSPAPS